MNCLMKEDYSVEMGSPAKMKTKNCLVQTNCSVKMTRQLKSTGNSLEVKEGVQILTGMCQGQCIVYNPGSVKDSYMF